MIYLNFVINKIENKYNTKLTKLSRKKIMFEGIIKDNKKIVLLTPKSKVHKNGMAWIDITKKQINILYDYDIAIIVFRIENYGCFFIYFSQIEFYLNKMNMIINSKEGEHWKLHISPNESTLFIQGSKNSLFNLKKF